MIILSILSQVSPKDDSIIIRSLRLRDFYIDIYKINEKGICIDKHFYSRKIKV
jgi:hypothetical protein